MASGGASQPALFLQVSAEAARSCVAAVSTTGERAAGGRGAWGRAVGGVRWCRGGGTSLLVMHSVLCTSAGPVAGREACSSAGVMARLSW